MHGLSRPELEMVTFTASHTEAKMNGLFGSGVDASTLTAVFAAPLLIVAVAVKVASLIWF